MLSGEMSKRLEAWALLFRACREAFHETADTHHWNAAYGSPAANDAAVLPSPDPFILDLRSESGHRLIAEVVQTFLLTASEHLGGLAALYTCRVIIFSPAVLTRTILENCAHAVRVLGEEVDAEHRLARCYLEEFKSAEEARTNAKHMHGEQHASYLAAVVNSDRIKTQIRGRFPGASVSKLRDGLLLDQELPGLKESVKLMYSLAEDAGGTITQDQASGIYGYLSNMTHPTLHPARQRRRWYADPEHEHHVAYLDIGLRSVENEARVSLASFYNALNYTNSYYGWPQDILAALEAKIDATIPGFFR